MVALLLNDPPEARDRQRSALVLGIALSLLLHVAGMALLLDLELQTTPELKRDIAVDMVQLPQPQPKPVEPPPEPLAERIEPPRVLPLPQAPVFNDGKLAETSAVPAPRRVPAKATAPTLPKIAAPTPPPPTLPTPTLTQPDAVEVEVAEVATSSPVAPTPATGIGQRIEATQAFRDFVLRQIVSRWELDVHGPRYRHIVLAGPPIVVRPDGTLERPWGKDDPWDPQRMIGNYDKLAEDDRRALVTFVQALRQAQPLQLPADDKSEQSRVFQLHFTLGDLPQ